MKNNCLNFLTLLNGNKSIPYLIPILSTVFFTLVFQLNTQSYGDSQTYIGLAERIIAGEGYHEYWPKLDFYQAWRPPLYSYFLSVVMKVDPNLSSLVFIQSLLFSVTSFFIFLTVKKIDSYISAVTAQLVFIFSYPAWSFIYMPMSEVLFMFLIGAGVYFIIDALKHYKFKIFFSASIIIGLASLTRTTALFVYLAVVVFILKDYLKYAINKKQLLESFFAIFLGFFISIIPWTIRNYLVLDSFVLINTANAMNLYFGTITNLDWAGIHKEVILPLRSIYNETKIQDELIKLSFQNIVANPLDYIILKFKAILSYLIPNTASISILPFFVLGLYRALCLNKLSVVIALLFLIMILGTSLAFQRYRFFIALYPLYSIIVGIGFYQFIITFKRLKSCSIILRTEKGVDK